MLTQKRYLQIIIFGIMLSFLVAGCGGSDAVVGSSADPFLGGSQGLELSFLRGTPPDEVADGDTFDFQAVLRLKNRGEFNLAAADVEIDLIGFLPQDFRSGVNDFIIPDDLNKENPDEDPGRREKDSEGNIIDAAEVFKTFPSDTAFFKYKDEITGNTDFTFRANVCYKYGTTAVADICILNDLVRDSSDALCSPRGSKAVFSSGSPIKVSSLRQSVVGTNKIQFSFDIVHSGRGDVFGVGVTGQDDPFCPKTAADKRTNENNVKIAVKTGLTKEVVAGENSLECVGLNLVDGSEITANRYGVIRLVDGKRTITCTQILEATNRGDFERNVDITLDFNYMDSVDKKVVVKSLIG